MAKGGLIVLCATRWDLGGAATDDEFITLWDKTSNLGGLDEYSSDVVTYSCFFVSGE